ncbi:DNA methyltransferase, partial [Flavobacterium sp. XS1P32]|uniref:DNA methyltransferase n=1 Tax=Flavobacterium sp. XS1P32 TaxID=3401726 RepID=UPI003AB07FE8
YLHIFKTNINKMNTTFKDNLISLLKTDSRLLDNEGELMINKIHDLADKTDEKLIELLIDNEETRKKFFIKIKAVFVIKTSDFNFNLYENKIDNSYTQFENRIGLTAGGKFLKDNNDVVLDFPYKDCILEGGQSTEDGSDAYFEWIEKDQHYIESSSNRKEIFFNEVLAKDEIDRLLEPKAFSSINKYSIDGESKVSSFDRNENGTIKDNLIIKGNNLLALHSLKKEFSGKIKVIYIDPPYNTGSDSFKYNDSFNHSTWLTFMRNRLVVAKELLTNDGIIMVQCSFHQFAYLKVLMNDKSLFKKHLCDFNIQVRHPDRALTGDKEYNDVIEYILIFSNNPEQKMPFVEVVKSEDDYIYSIKIKDDAKPETLKCDKKLVEIYTPDMYEVIKDKPSKEKYKKLSIRGSIREKNSSGRFFVKHLEKLKQYPSETLFKVPDMGDDAESHRYFYSAP